jgi:hypothetical protein
MRRLVLISMFFALGAPAADVATSVRTTFVEPWVKAVRTESAAQLTRFLHPKVQACINDRTREFFESEQLAKPEGLTPKHHITKLTPMTQPGPLFGLPEDGFAYPLQPTYELNLDDAGSDTVVILFLAPSGGKWYMVTPCPNEKGMVFFRQMMANYKAREDRIALLAGEVKEPLRTELKQLTVGGRLVDAAKRYRQQTGLDDEFLAIAVMKAISR